MDMTAERRFVRLKRTCSWGGDELILDELRSSEHDEKAEGVYESKTLCS